MILAPITCFPSPAKYARSLNYPPFHSPASAPAPLISSSRSLRISCTHKECKKQDLEGFSALSFDVPWESGSVWSTMGAYFFGLHIPLSFGGLSVVAHVLHQPVLDPLTEAVSLVLIQTLELLGALALLSSTSTDKQFKLSDFFFGKKIAEGRSWIMASAVGLTVLILLVLLTSLLANWLIGPKDVNNPIVKEILSSGLAAKFACFMVYCFITPLLEETIYRGFLLTCLTSIVDWRRAVAISACVFSAAHLSVENSLQLFLIGCILGSTYCWTGKLSSSFAIHSVYNALILLVTILS